MSIQTAYGYSRLLLAAAGVSLISIPVGDLPRLSIIETGDAPDSIMENGDQPLNYFESRYYEVNEAIGMSAITVSGNGFSTISMVGGT